MRSTGNSGDPVSVVLAPDDGIRPDLSGEHTRAAEFLLTAAAPVNYDLVGYGFVFVMAVEVIGETDREKRPSENTKGNINIRKQYVIHVGDGWTTEELVPELKKYRAEKGLVQSRKDRPFEHLDQWLFETQFPKLL